MSKDLENAVATIGYTAIKVVIYIILGISAFAYLVTN